MDKKHVSVPLTHNHALVGPFHNVKGRLDICVGDVKEDVRSTSMRIRVGGCDRPQENYVWWGNVFQVKPPKVLSDICDTGKE